MASPTLPETTPLPSERTRIAHFRPEDADQVAAMFNESDEGWPGGFTRGVPFTAERVLRLHRERQPLAILIAWEGETAAGYCTLYEYPEEPGTAGYIGLLNVPARFQGRGYGRDLLKAALRETLLRGYRRLDLGTWPGNMKAVPLYKKSGYFWRPYTSVHMQNFMPLLLAVPLLADFWRSCDWYQAQVRDLSVREDLYSCGKMRVYPYEFRHGERFVRATIDVESQGLTALETEQWRVACSVDDRILAIGRARTVRWEIENRTGRPLQITLLAQAGAGLRLSKEETVVVADRYATEAVLTADRDYQPPAFGKRAPHVESVILINGRPLRLETGVEVRPPIEIELEPGRLNLVPGTPARVGLRVRNSMDEPATLRLALAPSAALSVVAPAQDEVLAIEPEGYAGQTLDVTANSPGAHVLEVRASVQVGAERIAMAPRRLALPAVTPGQLLAFDDDAHRAGEREVRVESCTHRLVVSLREGAYRVEEARTGATLLGGLVLAGPPFGWAYQRRVVHEATYTEENGALTVRLRGALQHVPDAAVEHALTLAADGLVTAVTSFTNMGQESRQFRGAVWMWADRERMPECVLPTVHGLVASDDPEFPDWDDPALHDPSILRESWMARQGSGSVAAMLWSAATEIEAGHWSLNVMQETPPLAPGASHALPPVYLYTGPGDWRAARACWRRLIRPFGQEQDPEPRDIVALTAPTGRALLAGEENRLNLSSLANRAADGRLRLMAPSGWQVTPRSTSIAGLRIGRPQDLIVQMEGPRGAPAAAPIRGLWHTDRAVLPVFEGAGIVLGTGQRVEVTEERVGEQRLLTVDNGYLRFRIDPELIGSVVALETAADGVNHLHSAYPTPREFGWIRPWYGGLHAVVYHPGPGDFPDPARLYEERFDAEEVGEPGDQGRTWRGVAVRSALMGKGLRGLELRAAYLTLPGTNMVVVRLAVANRTSAILPVKAALVAHLQPGGTIEGAELLTTASADGRLLRVQRTEEIESDGWVGVRNPVSGTVLALVAGAAESKVYGVDWGIHGAHAGLTFSPRLGPGETQQILAFLVLAGDEAEARAYRALAGATALL